MNKEFLYVTTSQLKQIIALRQKIDVLQSEMNALLGPSSSPSLPPVKKRRKMSASAKAKIAAAQRKRWAKVKSEKPGKVKLKGKPGKPVKAKRKMSAEAKAKISAAAKLRWQKAKAEGKSGL